MADVDQTIRKIMIENVRTVLPQAPMVRAAQVLVQCRIRHLVVTESDGEVVGVLSERQVLKHFSPWLTGVSVETRAETPPPRCEVREIMAHPPITVRADTSLRTAADILAKRRIGCLPVVEDGRRLVGLVTSVDLLRFFGHSHAQQPQGEFHVFTPPAFFSENGDLTMPVGYFSEGQSAKEVLAVLAYAPKGKRIGVRLFKRGEEGRDLGGARPAIVTDKYIVIAAEDFVKHYNLNVRVPFEVAKNTETGYLVLSPVLKP